MDERKLIDTGSGICSLGPSKKVKAAIRRAVRLIGTGYETRSPRLRKFFSSKFGNPENAFVFSSSLRELVYIIPRVLRPKKVLVIGLSPAIYEEAAAACGAETSRLTAGEDTGFAPDPLTVAKRMEGIDLVFISNPNRLTGRLVDGHTIDRILGISEDGGPAVVMDESLIEFTGREGLFSRSHRLARTIVLRSTAFFHGLAGLELAYAAAEPSLAGRLAEGICGDLNVLSSEAARTALKDKTYFKEAVRQTREEKDFLARSLAKIVRVYDSDSNVYLLKTDFPADDLTRVMRKEGFDLRPRKEIGRPGENFFSLSVMEHDKNKKLARIMKDLLGSAPGA